MYLGRGKRWIMANAGARFTWMSSEIWSKPWFRSLSDKGKLLWFYLTTCSENTGAGIFQFDPDVVQVKTGKWRTGEWEKATEGLTGHINFYPENWVWVTGYVKHNYQNPNVKQAKGIGRIVQKSPIQLQKEFWEEYNELPHISYTPLIPLLEGYDTPLIPLLEGYDTPLIQSSPPLPSPPLPSPEGGVHHQVCVDAYHQGFITLTGTNPSIDSVDTRLLKQRLGECTEDDEWKKVLLVIEYAVSGKDKKFVEEPPALRTILSGFHYNRIIGKLSMGANQ
jgi:hypothetical protein